MNWSKVIKLWQKYFRKVKDKQPKMEQNLSAAKVYAVIRQYWNTIILKTLYDVILRLGMHFIS